MRLRLVTVGLLFGVLASAAVVDRIVIIVNSDLIKDSDISRDLLATQMLNGEAPDTSIGAKKKNATRLIDQVFIRDEINVGDYPVATEEEAGRQLEQLVASRYKSKVEFGSALRRYRLTEPDLREQFRWQLTVLRFIDARFRPAVLITNEATDQYYKLHLSQLKKPNQKESEDDLKTAAREALTEEAVNKLLFEWLDQHRHDAKIRYLEASLR